MSDSEKDLSQPDEHLSDGSAEYEDEPDFFFEDDDFQFQKSHLPTLHPSVLTDTNNNSRLPARNGDIGQTTEGSSPNQHSQEKPRVMAAIQSEDLVRALNGISVDKAFVDEFDQKFGTLHPSFLYGPFHSAFERAKQHQKLIIVFISTETTEGLNILLEETVADYIDINFLFWIGNYVKPSPQIDNIIRGMSPPIMAVVGADSRGNTNIVEVLHGIDNVDVLISRLMIIQDNFILAQQEASRERSMLNQVLENDRRLKLEQEQALLISQETDRRRQEEEEQIRLAILEQEEMLRVEQEKRENDVLEKQKHLPLEPTDPKLSTDVIFRLADGRRIQRKFHRNDTVETLYSFVQISCPELYIKEQGFQLVVSFPKKILTDREQTLSNAGLVPQALIHVQL